MPRIVRYPARVHVGARAGDCALHQNLVPTLLDLAGIDAGETGYDDCSLLPLLRGEAASLRSEFYISECTWMRKHGWRVPEWKLIVALEPDFHFRPPLELYNLVCDPAELVNRAEERRDVVALLRAHGALDCPA